MAGEAFPNPKSMFPFANPFSQAGIFVSQLVKNIPKENGRLDIAKNIIREAQPLAFALECFRWMRSGEKKAEQERIFSQDEEDELDNMLGERVREAAQSQEQPLYVQFPVDAPYLLWAWCRRSSRGITSQYLAETMGKNPRNALALLKCFVPTGWGLESGLPVKTDFEREQYDSLIRVVDPEVIYGVLRTIYKDALDTPQLYSDQERDYEEQLAHQFAYIHLQVKGEKKAPDQTEE